MTSDPDTLVEKGSVGKYPKLWNVRKDDVGVSSSAYVGWLGRLKFLGSPKSSIWPLTRLKGVFDTGAARLETHS